MGTDTGHDIVKMRALGITALTVTLIICFVTPYALLNHKGLVFPFPSPPGWPTLKWLYLQGVFSVNSGFLEWYRTDGLGLSPHDSALFWVLSLIAALQFLHPTPGRRQLTVHLIVLLFSVAAWILGVYTIYGDMNDYAVVPMPITPLVALIALLLIWMVSKRQGAEVHHSLSLPSRDPPVSHGEVSHVLGCCYLRSRGYS